MASWYKIAGEELRDRLCWKVGERLEHEMSASALLSVLGVDLLLATAAGVVAETMVFSSIIHGGA